MSEVFGLRIGSAGLGFASAEHFLFPAAALRDSSLAAYAPGPVL